MACILACKMLSCSISAMEAAPRATKAWRRMAGSKASRTEAESFLLSCTCSKKHGGASRTEGGKTTAAATTGPAIGPRPTSSRPATHRPSCKPWRISQLKSTRQTQSEPPERLAPSSAFTLSPSVFSRAVVLFAIFSTRRAGVASRAWRGGGVRREKRG